MAKDLWMVREDGEAEWQLVMGDTSRFEHIRPASYDDITLERMADLLDQDAENCNAHDFVFLHRALVALLVQHVERDRVWHIMRRLVDYEGLHGMLGVCGKGDVSAVEQDLGVQLRNWGEWKLPADQRQGKD